VSRHKIPFLAGVAHAVGDAVDGKLHGAFEVLTRAAGGTPRAQQTDLEIAERVDVRIAQLNRHQKSFVALQQFFFAGDLADDIGQGSVFGFNAAKHAVAQRFRFHQLRVTACDVHIGLARAHFHKVHLRFKERPLLIHLF